jgi:uncharacterized protein YwgA
MNRRQISTLLALKELGIEPKLDLFRDRLVLQKAVYLAQAAGCDLGYFYGWYVHGPYCSPFAKDMFAVVGDPESLDELGERWVLDDESRKQLQRLRKLISANHADLPRHLELMASVHYLITRNQLPDRHPHTVMERLAKFGKNFTEEEVRQAITALQGAGLLNAAED